MARIRAPKGWANAIPAMVIGISFLAPPVNSGSLLLWQNLRAGMTQTQALSALKHKAVCDYNKQFKETECKTDAFITLAGEKAFVELYFPKDRKLRSVRIWVSIENSCNSLFSNAGIPLTLQEKNERDRATELCERPLKYRWKEFKKQALDLYTRKYGSPSDLGGFPVWYANGRKIQLQLFSAGEFGILYREDKALNQI